MSDHSITSLIEKLEGAAVGSRELDCAIWTATGGWDHVGRPPTFSNSLDAARALAERVLPGWCWEIRTDATGSTASGAPSWWLEGLEAVDNGGVQTNADTPALALCAAVLRAQSEARV